MIGADDGYHTWLEEGKDEAEFRDELLDLKRYSDDHPDDELAGMPMSQDPDDVDYKPPALRGQGDALYRECDLVGGQASSDVDGDELAFEMSPLSQEELTEIEIDTVCGGLGLKAARLEANDLAYRHGDKARAYDRATSACCQRPVT